MSIPCSSHMELIPLKEHQHLILRSRRIQLMYSARSLYNAWMSSSTHLAHRQVVEIS